MKKTANFSYSNTKKALVAAVREIDKICKIHKNERGIIHTTSYEILNHLMENAKSAKRFVAYKTTDEKIKILQNWNSYPKNAVLIGPSLTQGVDMSDDFSRFNVIVKIPFPNVSSALWRKRFQKRRNIYYAEAAIVLEQAAGRATRHADDHSITYILDERADKFIKNKSTRKYFSDEFLKRIN
jgi:Rad3-related DNA helicase